MIANLQQELKEVPATLISFATGIYRDIETFMRSDASRNDDECGDGASDYDAYEELIADIRNNVREYNEGKYSTWGTDNAHEIATEWSKEGFRFEPWDPMHVVINGVRPAITTSIGQIMLEELGFTLQCIDMEEPNYGKANSPYVVLSVHSTNDYVGDDVEAALQSIAEHSLGVFRIEGDQDSYSDTEWDALKRVQVGLQVCFHYKEV